MKQLNEYLNKKRDEFPRFYFLSNDELLSILANTKEPRSVQKHMIKCFEGIASLTFDTDNNILEMNSPEGEVVKFDSSIVTMD